MQRGGRVEGGRLMSRKSKFIGQRYGQISSSRSARRPLGSHSSLFSCRSSTHHTARPMLLFFLSMLYNSGLIQREGGR